MERCLGLSGSELGGPSSALLVGVPPHRLPLELRADPPAVGRLLTSVLLSFGETDNSRQVKGGFLRSGAES